MPLEPALYVHIAWLSLFRGVNSISSGDLTPKPSSAALFSWSCSKTSASPNLPLAPYILGWQRQQHLWQLGLGLQAKDLAQPSCPFQDASNERFYTIHQNQVEVVEVVYSAIICR